MIVGRIRKQPTERCRRALDLSYELEGTLGTVATASVKAVTPTGLTVDSILVNSPQVFFWISGGEDQTTYVVEMLVTVALTDGTETLEYEFVVNVREHS